MMDQAENLRNIIKKQNLKNITNSRVIAVTSGQSLHTGVCPSVYQR